MKKWKFKKQFFINFGVFFLTPALVISTAATATASYATSGSNKGAISSILNKNSAFALGNGPVINIGGSPGRIIDVSPVREATPIIGRLPVASTTMNQNTLGGNRGAPNAHSSSGAFVDLIVNRFNAYKSKKGIAFSNNDVNLNFSDDSLFGSEYVGNNKKMTFFDIKSSSDGDLYGDTFADSTDGFLSTINYASSWTKSSASFETISRTNKERDVYHIFSTYIAGLLYDKNSQNKNILTNLLFKDYSRPEFDDYRSTISRRSNRRTDFVSLSDVLGEWLDLLISAERELSKGKNIDIFSMIVLLRIWLLNQIYNLNYGSIADALYKVKYEIMYEVTLAFDNVMRYINYLVHKNLDQFLSQQARDTNIDEAFEFSSLWFFTRKPVAYFRNIFSGKFTSHYSASSRRIESRPGFVEIFLISSLFYSWVDSFNRTVNEIDGVLEFNRSIRKRINELPQPKSYDVPQYIPNTNYSSWNNGPYIINPAYNPPIDYYTYTAGGVRVLGSYTNSQYWSSYQNLISSFKNYNSLRFDFPVSLNSIGEFLSSKSSDSNGYLWLDYWYKNVYAFFDKENKSDRLLIQLRVDSFLFNVVRVVNNKLNELNAHENTELFIDLNGKLNKRELLKYAIVTSVGGKGSEISLSAVTQNLRSGVVKYEGEDQNWVNRVDAIFELTDKIKSVYFELSSPATFGITSFVDAVVSVILFVAKGLTFMSKVYSENVVYEYNYGYNGGNSPIYWDGGKDEISYSFWGDKKVSVVSSPKNNMFVVFPVI